MNSQYVVSRRQWCRKEFAHIWRGASGVGKEDLKFDGGSDIERWCNAVASEVLVPGDDLATRHSEVAAAPLTEALDALAHEFRCGTLVVLQALRRTGKREIDNFNSAYDAEVRRLRGVSAANETSGGDHYNNQPFRIGERLSRALVADALEGRTPVLEAMRLMSMKSLSTFDEYVRRLGAA